MYLVNAATGFMNELLNSLNNMNDGVIISINKVYDSRNLYVENSRLYFFDMQKIDPDCV